jgi:hypothetical protein
MGEGSKGIEASSGENICFGSCKAHHVGIRPKEDRGGTAGAVGEGQSGEEEGVGVQEPAGRMRQAFTF